jgi:branched-chain amino acid aminotransferase
MKVRSRSVGFPSRRFGTRTRRKLQEAFGAGTAAAISPVIQIGSEEGVVRLPPVEERKIGPALLKRLDDIRLGRVEDRFGWMEELV